MLSAAAHFSIYPRRPTKKRFQSVVDQWSIWPAGRRRFWREPFLNSTFLASCSLRFDEVNFEMTLIQKDNPSRGFSLKVCGLTGETMSAI
jgi:hypothetical protein